jgi:hypothetical protein
MGGHGPRVTSAHPASTAAGVGVSGDHPDTYHVRYGMEHGQGHHQHRQPDIARGVRQR